MMPVPGELKKEKKSMKQKMLSEVLKERFGTKVYKLSLTSGCTCPNRDGHIWMSAEGDGIVLLTGGCTFCSEGGSGEFAAPLLPLEDQIRLARQRVDAKIPARIPMSERKYIAYFQSFSNTFAPLSRLQEAYAEALAHPAVSGLVIGTRPDCVDAEKLDYIASLGCARMEYGIESCRDETLLRVHRGHDFACAERAVRETAARGIPVCGHFILGLPGETRETLLEDVSRINALPLDSIKFHQLQILKGTPMAEEFAARTDGFVRWTLGAYIDFLVDLLERLRPDIAVGRLAASVPPRFLAVPGWGVRASDLHQLLERRLLERDTWQGKDYGSGHQSGRV
jgi:radical SAM protein (TIGR01212 family)